MAWQRLGMRLWIFLSGAAILMLGVAGLFLLKRVEGLGLLQGALTLGGGLVICGGFSVQMKWHGVIGAGILALLGAARGLGNLPDFLKWVLGASQRGLAPVLESAVTVVAILLLVQVIRALSAERLRRMLEPEE